MYDISSNAETTRKIQQDTGTSRDRLFRKCCASNTSINEREKREKKREKRNDINSKKQALEDKL